MDGPDVLVFAGVPLPPPGPGFLGIVIDEDSSAAHDDRHGQRDPVCASARLAVTCFTLAFSAGRSVPARAAIADPGVPRVRSGRPSAIVDARTSPVGSDTGC